MSTERIRIEVSQTGARAVRRDLEGLGAGAQTASRSLGGLGSALKGAIGVTAVAAAGRAAISLADSYTELSNRIRVVTRSEAEAVSVRSELFRVANQTRGSVTDLTAVYGRLALSTKSLGLSQREVIELTESLQQATALGGASSQEAAAALVQLSQGLGAGALRGQELNSVLEQAPIIAQTIADHLKVNVGELKAMGEQGKITGRDVVDAFRDAREELADRFGKSVPTVSSGVTVLKNSVTGLVGELDEATGSSAALANRLIDLSEWLDTNKGEIVALTTELVSLREFEGIFDRLLPKSDSEGLSTLQFMSLAVATLEDRALGAVNAMIKLGTVTGGGGLGAGAGIGDDLGMALSGQGPATERVWEVIRQFRGGRRGVTTLNEDPSDPHNTLDRRGRDTTKPAEAKGPTVQSVLADLRREGELLRMTNEQRRIEESLDRARDQLKGKLSQHQTELIRHQIEENRVLEVVNESLDEKLRLELELMDAEQRRLGEAAEIENRRMQDREELAAFERQKAFDRTFEGSQALMGTDFLETTRNFGEEMSAIFGPGGTLQMGLQGVVGSLADAAGYAIAFGEPWRETEEVIKNIGRSIVAEIISSLIRIPIQLAINEAIASGLRAKSTAEMAAASAAVVGINTTAALASANAWAPAAALANAATFGGASVAGSLSLATSVAAAKALAATGAVGLFAEGGYTGDGSRAGVAGLVHGQEYVLNADATSRYRGHLDAMNEGRWSPGGGGQVSVTIMNQAPGLEFETRQLSPSEVEIIVRRVAPGAVADDLRSPQSRVGRAISQEFSAKRVRS